MADPRAVGVFLGGTHIHAAVIDTGGAILGRSDPVLHRDGPAERLLKELIPASIREAVSASGVTSSQIKGIGLGLPGSIDRESGTCRYSPNLGWTDVPARDLLQEVSEQPVFVLNNVRCHTLGELHFGRGRGIRSFAMLALGRGIGGGLVLDGRLIEGAHSAGGEVGHMTVDPQGPTCGCGNQGCVEMLASGPAIGRAGQVEVDRGDAPGIAQEAGASPVTAAHVSAAAHRGDGVAIAILANAGRWIGVAAANLMTTLDPERVLIGGKVARVGDKLLKPIQAEVQKRCRMADYHSIPVMMGGLGDDAGVIGAGALALESMSYLPSSLVPHGRRG